MPQSKNTASLSTAWVVPQPSLSHATAKDIALFGKGHDGAEAAAQHALSRGKGPGPWQGLPWERGGQKHVRPPVEPSFSRFRLPRFEWVQRQVMPGAVSEDEYHQVFGQVSARHWWLWWQWQGY